MRLSVLIPSVPARVEQMARLFRKLALQAEPFGPSGCEILVLLDNKRRSIGLKRDALLKGSRGDYVCFVDDDDDVAPDYIASLLGAMIPAPGASQPDVITFISDCTLNGNRFFVHHALGHANEEWRGQLPTNGVPPTILRAPWQVCAWARPGRRGAGAPTRDSAFPSFEDENYTDDWTWCKKMLPHCKTSAHIPKALYYYSSNESESESVPLIGTKSPT